MHPKHHTVLVTWLIHRNKEENEGMGCFESEIFLSFPSFSLLSFFSLKMIPHLHNTKQKGHNPEANQIE